MVKKCPNCDKKFRNKDTFCTKCGAELVEVPHKKRFNSKDNFFTKINKKNKRLILIAIIVIILVVGVIAYIEITKPPEVKSVLVTETHENWTNNGHNHYYLDVLVDYDSSDKGDNVTYNVFYYNSKGKLVKKPFTEKDCSLRDIELPYLTKKIRLELFWKGECFYNETIIPKIKTINYNLSNDGPSTQDVVEDIFDESYDYDWREYGLSDPRDRKLYSNAKAVDSFEKNMYG